MPRLRSAFAALAAIVTVISVATLATASGGAEGPAPAAPGPAAWRGLVGETRPTVALGQRVIVLLKTPSLAERVRLAGGRASDAEERRWTAAALASQQQFMAEMAAKGIVARPEFRFTRVVNGFSGIVDPKAAALLERAGDVAGVYTVRAGFPASMSDGAASAGSSPLPSGLAAFTGRGVTVALLDTGVDWRTPFLHGRVLPGVDVITRGPDARAVRPRRGGSLEAHGTEIAGLVVGLGATGNPMGIAPDATVLPIRVAGWQTDVAGRSTIHARTDQVIAGLERAVDPDGDGDAHDAARITLVPLVEPFSAFSDGPLARAASGALQLDSLVIAPAGNDGPGGPVFGSVSGPGGAPAALTVGAVDLRPSRSGVPLTVRTGLRVLLRQKLDLLGTVAPKRGATFELVPLPKRLFDRSGRNRAAGKAVLVSAGDSPRATAVSAAKAGAAVVLLSGQRVPAGALGLDPALKTPVIAAPGSLARELRMAVRERRQVWISVGPAVAEPTAGRGRPAAFSSWGLAFGAHVKPDLGAPGVGLATALPGAGDDRRSSFVTVNGSSAAAAVAAGAAARLAQARPDLDARALRSVLAGTARRLGRGPLQAQGAGVLDVGRAAAAEIASEPASVSFGRVTHDGWQRRDLIVRNVSTRRMTVFAALPRRRYGPVSIKLEPHRLRIEPGGAARIRLRALVTRLSPGSAVSGLLRLAPVGSVGLVVPWSVALSPVDKRLIGDVRLSDRSFEPSDDTPAVLAVRAGLVGKTAGRTFVEPVLRLDLKLLADDGRQLGLLARLRDLLPGRYAFGLTGRDPAGKVLAPGRYRLMLLAWPAAGGGPVRRTVDLRIE